MTTVALRTLAGPSDVVDALAGDGYLADDGLATAVLLALRLRRPLLLEGEPGVGKTEVARALARVSGARLLRLQCHEGLDASQALYEWDWSRQLLHLRAAEAAGVAPSTGVEELEHQLHDERYLLRRPVLEALTGGDGPPPVLLVDEVDRADDEFEAVLLEVLSDYAVTVPELGTFRAAEPPIVVLTSNRTREVHDALKRRCLYHWLEHPGIDREVAIVRRRAPEVGEALARQVASLVEGFRSMGLVKPPGVAESIDWAVALGTLGRDTVDAATAGATLGAVLKYREDQERVLEAGLDGLVAAARDRVG